MREFISAEGFVLFLVLSFALLGLLLVDWDFGLFLVDLLDSLVLLHLYLVLGLLSELSESDLVLELCTFRVCVTVFVFVV